MPFVNVTEPGTDKSVNLLEESTNGTLTPEQFKLLRPIFYDQLRKATKQITGWYQKHQARYTGSKVLTLTEEQVKDLNGQSQSTEFDLLWSLDRQREDICITKIELESINLLEPFPTTAHNLSLE